MTRIFNFYLGLLRQNRAWIWFTAALAVFWLLFGFVLVLLQPQLFPIFLQKLSEMFDQMLGPASTQPGWPLAQALLQQNFLASFYDLIIGIVLGLVPLASVALNAFILGFLAGPFVQPQMFGQLPIPSFGVFLLSILPHGIFEIPAVLVSAAFGIRAGWAWILPSAAGRRMQVFKGAVLDNTKLLPLILFVLIIAALVEAFITPALIR